MKSVALVFTSRKKALTLLRSSVDRFEDDDGSSDLWAECDSEDTIEAVGEALGRYYRVTRVEGDEHAYQRLRKLRPDLVFNIAEGFRGPNRESHIPIICEMLGLAYTGSDALTLSICLNKARTKEILGYHQFPTARFRVIAPGAATAALNSFALPALVKPLHEGSSIGIRNGSLVRTRPELLARVRAVQRRYHQPALVEEFLPGREFSVGVLGNAPAYEVLPPVEINHRALPKGANHVYGFEAKWLWDNPAKPLPILICPARISARLAKRIRDLVCRALEILGVRDWCRVDLRLDASGNPHLLELNPLPGILPAPSDNSALPAAARAAGYSYQELILEVAKHALRRKTRTQSL
ncbi:MAG: D-alanine--D-alanine ligase [Lentisphaerae bacterium]|nr:D-alanine--D-alanine ligase [Lentisphaerota bacterium]